MLKRFIFLCLVSLPGFSQTGYATEVFKIATVAPDSTIWMKQLRSGAEQIEQRTEGRVKLKFYPGGVMGNDRAVLRKLRIGQLQGGAVTTGTLADVFPDAQIYSLPLEFNSIEEVTYVRKHMDNAIADGLQKKGLIMLGLSNGGFAYIAGNKPVVDVEKLKAQRVWLPQGDVVGQAMYAAANVSPVPLAIPDVYTALQTGLLDTVVANPSSIIAFQWHTKIQYLTDVPMLFLMGTLVVDRRAFDRVSAEDQSIMREVMSKVFSQLDDLNVKDNIAAREALLANGVKFVNASDEERLRWKELADRALQKLLADGRYTKDFLAILRMHLQKYRSQSATDAAK
ncbi:MAG: TRAP transporter substrate-binding protein DctP [Gammaproteobacteria bacterium]|nr:TRAP transporter substrate-binding protein DctP [Gammaproteobacteria bacterium]